MHPVVLLKATSVAALAAISPLAPLALIKGVEFARFGNHLGIVNHRSSPVNIGGIKLKKEISRVPSAAEWLATHSTVCLQFQEPKTNRG